MTDTTSSQGVGSTIPRQTSAREASRAIPEPTGWVGWIQFAAVMMVMMGIFHAIEGLVALFDDGYYLVGPNGLTVNVDYTTWGWTHLVVGIVVVAAGIGLFAGQMWARVVGIGLATLSAIVNFAFIAAYPFWSSIVIAIDVFIILALTVHGREMKALA